MFEIPEMVVSKISALALQYSACFQIFFFLLNDKFMKDWLELTIVLDLFFIWIPPPFDSFQLYSVCVCYTQPICYKVRFLKQSPTGLNLELSFKTSWCTKNKEPSLPYYLLKAGKRKDIDSCLFQGTWCICHTCHYN